MYAVIRSGGKQYKVSKDDIISVEKLTAEAGDKISIDEVLMISEKDNLILGDPIIKGATVNAEVLEQTRAKKIIVFKKKRRHNYRRKKDLKNLGARKIDYLENYNIENFKKINRQNKKFNIFIAYYIKNTRLIDNI